MGHPCVSCAMRGSLVELLDSIAAVDRYDVAIVSVPGAGDTQALAEEIARDDRAPGRRGDHRGRHRDRGRRPHRRRADPRPRDRDGCGGRSRRSPRWSSRQLEYADAVVLSADDEPTASALIQAINPQARVRPRRPASSAYGCMIRTRPRPASSPARSAAPLPTRTGLVRTLVWQSARPFHPERLYDALEDLVAGTARGRGTVWIATQHRSRLELGQLRHQHLDRRARSVARRPAGRPLGRRSASSTRPARPSSGTPSTATARRTCPSPESTSTSGN